MSSSPSSTEPKAAEPQVEPVVPVVEGEPAATSEEDYIRLNRKELSNEIKRLQSEDKEFLQVYNSHVGQAAKQRWEPEIQRRDNRIADLQKDLRRLEILQMDEETVQKQFETDPAFAIEYAELVHRKPSKDIPIVDETPQILEAWNELVSWAKTKGIPDSKIEEVTNRAANGEFSSDGRHWSVALQRVQAELTDDIVTKRSPSSTVNPELAKKGPDLTPASRDTAQLKWKSVAEFKALPVKEQEAIIATPDGMAAVMELTKKGR